MKKKAKQVVLPPPPFVADGGGIPKEGILGRVHGLWAGRKAKREARKQLPIPTDHDTVHLRKVGTVLARSLPEGWTSIPSGLACGSAVGDLRFRVRQFFESGDALPHAIGTKTLLARARSSQGGFRGLATACAMESQGKHLPNEWQGKRFYFLARYFVSSPEGVYYIPKLEHNGQRWQLTLEPLYENVWTAKDYFIVEQL